MKVCIVQTYSIENEKLNLDYAKNVLKNSAKKKCDLVVFPELYLTGYVASEKTKALAITLNSNPIKSLEKSCKENNIACVVGFPRKDRTRTFNSACFIDKNGEIAGVYDKTHLFGDEKLYFSAGNELKVFNTTLGKVGLLICYDVEFPETARILALNGADIIICISANMKPYDDLHKMCITSRAVENAITVVYCNYVGKNGMFTFVGKSNAINRDGKNLCKFSKHKKLLYANLNISEKCKDENMNYLNNLRRDLYKI